MIKDLYKGYLRNIDNYNKIYEYYKGNTDAILSYTTTDRSNLKVNCNYLKKFVKEEASYSVGNNISYSSKSGNEDIIEAIDGVCENFKENHDIDTFRNMVLFATVYEVYFLDKWNDLQVKTIKPTEGYHTTDEEGNTTAFIQVYSRIEIVKDQEEVVTYVDHYTDKTIEIYKMIKDEFTLIDTKEHYFGEIPVGVGVISEELFEDTIYSDIKGLQDALETNLSDISNEISDFRNAYLVLTGVSLDSADAQEMKSNGIIEMPLAEGKAEWLIKNINDTFIQNTISTLKAQIYELTSHINHNDADQMSNASGVALKSRLISLTQRCKLNEGAFRELLKTRIRIILTYLKIKESKAYNWKDVQAKFTPLIPGDDNSIADLIQKLDGKLSAETGLQLLSFVENGQVEYEKAQKEINEAIPFDEAPSFNANNEIEE